MNTVYKGDPYAAWAGAEKRLQNAMDTITDLRSELAALRAERDALKVAAELYARPENWKSINGLMVFQTMGTPWGYAQIALESKA